MTTSDLTSINAALTRTGHDQITALDDGSAEAECAAANYEIVVRAALKKYPWSWASEYAELDLLDETPINEWAYVFEKPSEALKVTAVMVAGYPIDYKQRGSNIYCNENASVVADIIVRAPEEDFSDDFTEALIVRLEALFLRALAEKHDEAAARDGQADYLFKLAYNDDAKNKTARDRRTSRLVTIRA